MGCSGLSAGLFNRLSIAGRRSLDGWIAINVFGLDPAVLNLGWGGATDTPLFYIHVLVLLVFSALIAITWSVLDRKRLEYASLHAWVRLFVRYSLAASLFWYGFAKVFLTQMAPLWMFAERLVQPFGEMPPAGLLWAFVGYSPAYQIFGGVAEVAAASFLLFRRTTTLGAFLAIGVLLNVVMLNFGYHVDVKVSSTNMLVAAVFLAAPDLAKVIRFFVFNQRVDSPDASDPTSEGRWAFRRHTAQYDNLGTTATLFLGSDRKKYVLQCSRPDQDHLVMEGQLGDDALTIRMKRIDLSRFRLLNSPFRWTGRTQIF